MLGRLRAWYCKHRQTSSYSSPREAEPASGAMSWRRIYWADSEVGSHHCCQTSAFQDKLD